MIALRFCKPIWSNWQKAVAAARTASSRLPKTPSSPASDGPAGRSLRSAPPPPVKPAAMRRAMTSISWSVRAAKVHLVLFILVHAADLPTVHDRHDHGVTRTVLRGSGLARGTAGGDQDQFVRASADGVHRHGEA